jgi:hypothetical protein
VKAKELFSVWKKVFSNWKYIALAFSIAIIFYSLNVFIANFSSLISSYSQLGFFKSIKFFFDFFVGFKNTTFLSVFITLIVLSIFLGILFSLIAYKVKMIKSLSKKTGFFATAGIFFGVLGFGCAACGVGLLSLFGIGAAALNFLPFKGLEISVISAIIFMVLIFKITKDINKEIVCKIDERG